MRRLRRTLAVCLAGSFLASCSSAWSQSGDPLPRHSKLAPTSALRATASGSFLVGQSALAQGDFAMASGSFAEALASDPGNTGLRSQVFQLDLIAGNFTDALVQARALGVAGGDDPRLLLALEQVKAGDFRAAKQGLDRLASQGVLGLALPILKAWALFGAGDTKAAIAALDGKAGGEGLATLRAYHRAIMLGLSGEAAAGLKAMAPLVADEARTPTRVLIGYGYLLAASGDRAAAEKLFSTYENREPDGMVLEAQLVRLRASQLPEPAIHDARTGMADTLLGLGEALQDQQGGGRAIQFSRFAQYLAPEQGDAALLLAQMFREQGNPAEASEILSTVPATSPFAWQAQLAQANALDALGRLDEARALLRTMAADKPERIDALVALGDSYRRAEDYPDAEKAYTEAIGRLARPGSRDWRLYYARGIALERTERWPEAETDLLKALELQPDEPSVLNYLGYSWVDKGENLDRAKQMLHRAVELRPDDGFVVDSLGWAYFRLGDYQQAVTFLERAAELQPGDPVINDHLGDAYWRVGRTREARFQWQQVLELKPEPSVATEVKGKLANGLPAATKRG